MKKRRLTLSDIKTYYKAIICKRQMKKVENSKKGPFIYADFIHNKGGIAN